MLWRGGRKEGHASFSKKIRMSPFSFLEVSRSSKPEFKPRQGRRMSHDSLRHFVAWRILACWASPRVHTRGCIPVPLRGGCVMHQRKVVARRMPTEIGKSNLLASAVVRLRRPTATRPILIWTYPDVSPFQTSNPWIHLAITLNSNFAPPLGTSNSKPLV
jgi:hypothetical protein